MRNLHIFDTRNNASVLSFLRAATRIEVHSSSTIVATPIFSLLHCDHVPRSSESPISSTGRSCYIRSRFSMTIASRNDVAQCQQRLCIPETRVRRTDSSLRLSRPPFCTFIFVALTRSSKKTDDKRILFVF